MRSDPFLPVLLLAGLLVHGALAAWAVTNDRPLDYYAYAVAARSFLAGENAYRATDAETAGRARSLGLPVDPPAYLYPTLTALVVAPLSFLPPRTGALVWAGAGVLAGLGAALLLVRDARAVSRARRRAFLLLAVTGVPALVTLWAGQVNAIVLLLTVIALLALERRRDLAAGVVLALSVFLKPFAIALLPLLVLRRRGRALAGFALGAAGVLAASLLVFGVEATCDQFGRVVGVASSGARTELTVQNLHSLVTRTARALSVPDGAARLLDLGARAAVGILAVVVVARRRDDGAIGPEAAFLVLTTLLVSPLTWYHHLVLVVPAVASWTLGTPAAARPAAVVAAAAGWIALDLHGLAWKRLAALPAIAQGLPALVVLFLWAGVAWFTLRPGAAGLTEVR